MVRQCRGGGGGSDNCRKVKDRGCPLLGGNDVSADAAAPPSVLKLFTSVLFVFGEIWEQNIEILSPYYYVHSIVYILQTERTRDTSLPLLC